MTLLGIVAGATGLIPFPRIDPIALRLGPLAIRWYGLGYVAGLTLGWAILRRLVARDEPFGAVKRPDPAGIDDMLLYAAIGVVIGGRLGDALFYEPGPYLRDPVELFRVWHGGMAFHGGLIGAALGLAIFARRQGLRVLATWDLAALVAPIGIFIVRIANFIKPELWGRPTDVPWAMIFPGADGQPRHPSQLYEAGLEGLATFVVVSLAAWRFRALRRPGLVTGLFAACYGAARIASEFFRDPDPVTERLAHGLTMGMVLSAPLILIGIFLIVRAKAAAASDS